MKTTSLFEQVKCIVSNDCSSRHEYTNENQQEEIQIENSDEGFHPFDIDEVFAN